MFCYLPFITIISSNPIMTNNLSLRSCSTPHGGEDLEDLKTKYLKTKNITKFFINCSQYLSKSGFHMLDEFIAGSLHCQIMIHQDLLLEDSIWQHGEVGVGPIGDAMSQQGEHHQPHRSMAVPVQWWRISSPLISKDLSSRASRA